MTRSTLYGTFNVETGLVRNITVKHCTMYGGLRARNATFAHVSDVRFLLDGFASPKYFAVVDMFDTTGLTLLVENVFATAKNTSELHLVSMISDANSTAVVRNVTADSFRGIFVFQYPLAPLREVVLENVRATNTVFLLYSVRTRNVTISNVEIDAVREGGSNIVFTEFFEVVRVTNMSVTGSIGNVVLWLTEGAPNAQIVMRDIRISNATFPHGVFGRQAENTTARGYEFTNILVRNSTASASILNVVTTTASSLTGLTLIDTVVPTAVLGDFHAISGVTVQRSRVDMLINAVISVPQDVAWTGFDVQNSTFLRTLPWCAVRHRFGSMSRSLIGRCEILLARCHAISCSSRTRLTKS